MGNFSTTERDGHLFVITINRPEVMNALHPPGNAELSEAFDEFAADPDLWVAIITGAGPRAFSAGNDLKYTAAGGDRSAAPKTGFAGLTSRFDLTKPVIAAVNGVAAGGGLSLALSGDLVVATESAKLTMAYSKIAATPDGSSSYFLPRLVGLRRAMDLYFTNRVLTAREAQEWGLVTRVFADAEFKAGVDTLAHELAQGPSKAFGGAKRLFHESTWQSLETQMELEAQAIANSGRTEDFAAGVTAFASKKTPPPFKGR
jgi:acetyl-CoA C-acetyltransferase